MMNKEQLNILMKKIDKTKKPKHWRKFINNNVETHKHINILNVAYHLCLEIVEENGYEHKVICPFCRL